MTAVERQMAADAIALSKEHADRADVAEARWAALGDWLAEQIQQGNAAERWAHASGLTHTEAEHSMRTAVCRTVLEMMHELESGTASQGRTGDGEPQ